MSKQNQNEIAEVQSEELEAAIEPGKSDEIQAPRCQISWEGGRLVLSCESISDLEAAVRLLKGPVSVQLQGGDEVGRDQLSPQVDAQEQ